MSPVDPYPAVHSIELMSIVESLTAIQNQLLHILLCSQEPAEHGIAKAGSVTAALHVDVQRAEDAIRELNRRLFLLLCRDSEELPVSSERS